MPKPKPFLTYDLQINKLTDDKHLVMDDESAARTALKRIGYICALGGS